MNTGLDNVFVFRIFKGLWCGEGVRALAFNRKVIKESSDVRGIFYPSNEISEQNT